MICQTTCPNTSKFVRNVPLPVVFSIFFSVFGNVVKRGLSSLIYIIGNWKLNVVKVVLKIKHGLASFFLGQIFTLLRLIDLKIDLMVHMYFFVLMVFLSFCYGFQGFWTGNAPRF